MTNHWGLRIDRSQRSFFVNEMENGHLRQGWSYRPNQNLRVIQAARKANESLDTDQQGTWRRVRRMLSDESDGIQVGDVIVVPHLHKYGTWSLIRVTGPYAFEIPECGDYGHILPAKYAVPQQIDAFGAEVSAELRQSMKNQLPLWSLNRHGRVIEAIIRAANDGSLSEAPSEIERLQNALDTLSSALWDRMKHHYQASEFEQPCQRLLEQIFGAENVERRAGRSENGADFLCGHTDPFGTTHSVAVQVKMWEGSAEWKRPLGQIRQAYESYPFITSGIILTTATHEEPGFKQARGELENELGIRVRMICREELLSLFIKYLPDMASFDTNGLPVLFVDARATGLEYDSNCDWRVTTHAH